MDCFGGGGGWGGGGCQGHAEAVLPSGKRRGDHCAGGWVDPRTVWASAENLSPTEISSQDRPARSDSLSQHVCAFYTYFLNDVIVCEHYVVFFIHLHVKCYSIILTLYF